MSRPRLHLVMDAWCVLCLFAFLAFLMVVTP